MAELSLPPYPSADELTRWLPAYTVQRRVQAGREEAVYLARQEVLQRPVWLHLLDELPEAGGQALLGRLRRLAKLVHPSIAALYDFGRTQAGFLYLVTERVEGLTLAELVREQTLKPRRAFPLALQLCDALQRVHDQQLCHGALDPETVRVTSEDHIKLTAVGMARVSDGKLSWRLPTAHGFGEDLVALGRVLHLLLARRLPEPEVAHELPPAIAQVLRQCLSADARFRSPYEVRVALAAALQQAQAAVTESPASAGTPSVAVRSVAQVPQAPRALPPSATARRGPTILQRLDRLLWSALHTGLHLLITGVSLGSLLLLFLFRDRIVIEEVESKPSPVAQAEPAIPASVMGALPPPLQLSAPSTAPSRGSPVKLPEPPLPSPTDPQAQLLAEYLAAVQTATDQALAKVQLDDLPHYQRELQRLQRGEPLPMVDEPDLPASLKALRARFRQISGQR